jgi:hypothetical protein
MPLCGYCGRTEDVCSRFAGRYIPLDQAHIVHIGAEQRRCSDNLRHLSRLDCFTTPDTFVGIIPGGRAIYDYGVVLTPDNKLLVDISPVLGGGHPSTHPVLWEPYLPPLRKLDTQVAVISSQAHQRYFHWLFDIVPRFDLIRRSKVHVDQYLVNTEHSFQRETLEILGIPAAKVISPSADTHIQAQTLIVPSLPGQLGLMTPRSCEFLRKTFLGTSFPNSSANRVIYVTRRDALTRRVLNEEELLNRMSRYDVETITLEDMTVSRQAGLFANALLIIAPHGAGLANTVFCPKHSAVIEFMPETYENPCFEILAGFLSLRYVRIPSRSVSPANHDQYVEAANVEAAIEAMLASRY